MAHAAAKTTEMAREGFVAMLGPFIDTIIVCTMTALVIVSTGVWQVHGADDKVLYGPGGHGAPMTVDGVSGRVVGSVGEGAAPFTTESGEYYSVPTGASLTASGFEQGLGRVGLRVAERLRGLQVRVLATEVDEDRLARAEQELGIEPLEPGSEFGVSCDIFSPCAMGGILHDITISRLDTRVVCGASNNPLARSVHGLRLHERTEALPVPGEHVHQERVLPDLDPCVPDFPDEHVLEFVARRVSTGVGDPAPGVSTLAGQDDLPVLAVEIAAPVEDLAKPFRTFGHDSADHILLAEPGARRECVANVLVHGVGL